MRLKPMSRAWLAAALVVTWTLPAQASEGGATALIEETVAQVIDVLKDDAKSTAERRKELEAIAHARFDFRTMSRLVLGRNWKRLDDGQRSEFVEAFTTYLANDYGSRLDRYEQEEVAVTGEEPKPRGDVVVKTQIVGGENDGAQVDYRMRHRNDKWRIIDVVIEGISLVANFRDQFSEVIGNQGPEGLLRKLKEKNAQNATA